MCGFGFYGEPHHTLNPISLKCKTFNPRTFLNLHVLNPEHLVQPSDQDRPLNPKPPTLTQIPPSDRGPRGSNAEDDPQYSHSADCARVWSLGLRVYEAEDLGFKA